MEAPILSLDERARTEKWARTRRNFKSPFSLARNVYKCKISKYC